AVALKLVHEQLTEVVVVLDDENEVPGFVGIHPEDHSASVRAGEELRAGVPANSVGMRAHCVSPRIVTHPDRFTAALAATLTAKRSRRSCRRCDARPSRARASAPRPPSSGAAGACG